MNSSNKKEIFQSGNGNCINSQHMLHMYMYVMCICARMLNCFSCISLFATPWTVAHRAPLSMEFPRQEYWSHFLPQYVYITAKYYSVTRKKEILPFVTTQMNVEDIILSKISQTKANIILCYITYMQNIKKKKNKVKLIETEQNGDYQRLGVTDTTLWS